MTLAVTLLPNERAGMYTLPLDAKSIANIFKNGKKDTIVVDIGDSALPIMTQLTYLTNLDIPAQLYFSDITVYVETVLSYMRSPMLLDFEQLERGVLDILFHRLGVETPLSFFEDKFDEPENKALIDRWVSLVGSLSVFNLKHIDYSVADIEKQYPIVTDKDTVGINFVNVIGTEDLPLIISLVPEDQLFYYKEFFEGTVYKGQSLGHYWFVEDNTVFVHTLLLNSKDFDKQEYFRMRDIDVDELIRSSE